jgi:hypothetical protein
VWQADLKKEAGLGARYSFVDFVDVEARIRELVVEGKVQDADAVMGVVECFEGWSRARTVRKWLEREVRSAGGRVGSVEEGWYRIFRPVEGGAGVLVATTSN